MYAAMVASLGKKWAVVVDAENGSSALVADDTGLVMKCMVRCNQRRVSSGVFLPVNTVITGAIAVKFAGTGATTTAVKNLFIWHTGTGAKTIKMYSRNDATHPRKLRFEYQRDSDGAVIEEDWTTWGDDETAVIEIEVTMKGDSTVSASARVVDVTLRKNGGAVKTVVGIRMEEGEQFPFSMTNTQADNDMRASAASPWYLKGVIP